LWACQTHLAGKPVSTGFARQAALALRSWPAALALDARRTHRPFGPSRAGRSRLARWPQLASRTYRANLALRAGRPHLAALALQPPFARRSRLAPFARRAVTAVAHARYPLGAARLELGDDGLELGEQHGASGCEQLDFTPPLALVLGVRSRHDLTPDFIQRAIWRGLVLE
jgi:hypothetical protein